MSDKLKKGGEALFLIYRVQRASQEFESEEIGSWRGFSPPPTPNFRVPQILERAMIFETILICYYYYY